LGRAADPSGVSYNLELLKKGWTLSAIRSQFAYSAEEKTDINNLYLKYLGRSVDTDGLAYIQNLLATSITLTSVVSVIESSREYQDRAYTISLYEKLFNRSGDAAGIAAGTQFLLSGGTQSALRAQFAYSPEEQGYLNVIYESDLGREIDASALAYYEELLAQSETLFQVSQTVLSSPERRDRVYTVNLFNDLLNRSGDASGIAAGTHFLLTGGTEAALRVQFAYSPEEERDINAIYLKHLKRPVDPNGLAYYQNLLSTSWTLNEVASNVEASPEAKNLK
jgi:hypothetical protein